MRFNKKIMIHCAIILGYFGIIATLEVVAFISSRLELMMAIFVSAFAIGILLLYWEIFPLFKRLSATKLIESEKRFKLALDYSPLGMALLSLKGQWLTVNNALCKILGYSEEELLQKDFQSITHPDDLPQDLDYLSKLNTGEIPSYELEKRYIRKDQTIVWVLLINTVIRDTEGVPQYYLAQVQDITEKKKTEHELSYKAYYDSLTGLFNRNQLEQSLERSILDALQHQNRFAIFFLDLDNFKLINDTLGHDIGDHLLKVVGERLKSNIRKTDIAARLGGDEFILVLNGIATVETAALFAEKIINVIVQPIKVREHELFITTSIGISFYPTDGDNYNALIKSADLALYKAKGSGRNNYQFCTPEMNNEIKEKINFKQALKKAFNDHEFHLVYLPKLAVTKNSITGFEVLLRWKNEKYGNVAPNKIIPLADEMGIISQLSEWIIQTSSEKAKVWQQYGSPNQTKIAINISAKHYIESSFVDSILQILKNTQLPPDYLQLEINENLIMRDPDYSLKVIQELKRNGVQIIIDNFGTGYSSLNYLHQFMVDYIKIDRKFTHNIVTDDHRLLFLMAMVKLAKNFDIKTLAEGVESKDQSDLLAQIGFDEIQGFYISPPLMDNQVPGFLENYAKTHLLFS